MKDMSERKADGTFVRIAGLYPELEGKYGHIVGYAEGNPIVQMYDYVSDQYPYSTLIVPEHCLANISYGEEPHNEDLIAEILDFAIEDSNAANEWRTQFCRKLYHKLFDTMRRVSNTVDVPVFATLVTNDDLPADHYHVGTIFKKQHFFSLKVVWNGYLDEEHGKSDVEFLFDVTFSDPVVDEQNEGIFVSKWNGTGRAKVAWRDPNMPAAQHMGASRDLSEDLNLDELVSAWWEIQQEVWRMVKR